MTSATTPSCFDLWHVQDPGVCHVLPMGKRQSANKEDLGPRRLRGAPSHPPTGAVYWAQAYVFVLLCVLSVMGGLAEIRWPRRPLVCRWQDAEYKGCVSAWEVLRGRLWFCAMQALSLSVNLHGAVHEPGEEVVLL